MYREPRIMARMVIEEAAWRLHVGIRSLYRYESGESIPPADVVCMMAKVYNAPDLLCKHCTQNCPIGMKHGCPAMIKKETAPCGAA